MAKEIQAVSITAVRKGDETFFEYNIHVHDPEEPGFYVHIEDHIEYDFDKTINEALAYFDALGKQKAGIE